jgi:very-short-patch-repair endonuclease
MGRKQKLGEESLPLPGGGEGRGEGRLKSRARVLRKNLTDAERLLWRHLRNRNLSGYKFRRQHPLGPFIADFVCTDGRLIVELDGGQHALSVEEDSRRSAYMKSEGYRVVRFWNDQVLKETTAVSESILRCLEGDDPSSRPSPLPVEKGKNF